jgi:hypothetical protein
MNLLGCFLCAFTYANICHFKDNWLIFFFKGFGYYSKCGEVHVDTCIWLILIVYELGVILVQQIY